MEGLLIIALVIAIFFIWLYPILHIARSDRTHGTEKVAWVMITAFIFWFAWVLYLLIAPIDKSHRQ